MLTCSYGCDKRASMIRSATLARPHGRGVCCFRLLLALSAILFQVLIAAPHEAQSAIASHPGSGDGCWFAVGSDVVHAFPSHDAGRCSTCQAAAHGRSALGTDSSAQVLILPRVRKAVGVISLRAPDALGLLIETPRAPPA